MDNKLDKHQKIENQHVFEQMFLNNLIKIIKSQSRLKGRQRINKVISKINHNSFLKKISIDWEKYLPIFFHYLDQMKKLLIENIRIVKDEIKIVKKQIDNINSEDEFKFELNQLEDNLTNLRQKLKKSKDNYLSILEWFDDFNYMTFREKIDYFKLRPALGINDSWDNFEKFLDNREKILNYFLKISNSIWTPYLTFCKDKIDKLFNDKNINFYKGIFYIYVNRDNSNRYFNESISSIVALFIRQVIEDSSFTKKVKDKKTEKIEYVLKEIHDDKLLVANKNTEAKLFYDFLKEKLKIIFNNKKENYRNIFSIINNMFNGYIHANIKIEPASLRTIFVHLYFWLHHNSMNSNNFEFTMYYYLFIYKIFIPQITIPNKRGQIKYWVSKDKLYIINKINKNKLGIQNEINESVQEIINKISDYLVSNNQYLTNEETKQLWNNFKLNKDKYFDWEKDSIEVLFSKYQVLDRWIAGLFHNSKSWNINNICWGIQQSPRFNTIRQTHKDPSFIEIVDQFLTCYQVTECLLSIPFLFILYALLLDNKITKETMNEALNYGLFGIRDYFFFELMMKID